MMLTTSGAVLLPFSRVAVSKLNRAPPALVYSAQAQMLRVQMVNHFKGMAKSVNKMTYGFNMAANQMTLGVNAAANSIVETVTTTAQRVASVPKRISQIYAKFCTDRPFLSSALTAGTILSAADMTCQFVLEKAQVWNPRRTLALASFGFFYYGGPLKALYMFYEKAFTCWMKKCAFDVLVHTPFLLLPAFYLITCTVKGKSLTETMTQIANEWYPAAKGSIAYWGPVCMFNFTMVPPHLRVLVLSMASFFHKIWLSWMSNGAEKHDANVEPVTPTTQTNAAAPANSTPRQPIIAPTVHVSPTATDSSPLSKVKIDTTTQNFTVPDPSFHIPIVATVEATLYVSAMIHAISRAIVNGIQQTVAAVTRARFINLGRGPSPLSRRL